MNESRGYYAKWNKIEKDKYCMVSLLTCVEYDENKSNLQKQKVEKWVPRAVG